MPICEGVNFRRAVIADAFPMMNLYQLTCKSEPVDSVLLNYQKLVEEMPSEEVRWHVAEREGKIIGVFSLLVEPENRLARLNRLILDPRWADSERLIKAAFPFLLDRLKDYAEILYTTTRTLTMEQQDLTLKMGFKLLGIFPNATGADRSGVNGITAFFFDDVLGERSHSTFRLHPAVLPYYEVVRRQCGLNQLMVWEGEAAGAVTEYEALPALEIILAPNFVMNRFERLKERRTLSAHFYPFLEAQCSDHGAQTEDRNICPDHSRVALCVDYWGAH